MISLDQEQRLALAKLGRCQCMACGKLATFGEAVVVAQQNQVMASFCSDCFAPGRGFMVHSTAEGVVVRPVDMDAPSQRIIMPETAVPLFGAIEAKG